MTTQVSYPLSPREFRRLVARAVESQNHSSQVVEAMGAITGWFRRLTATHARRLRGNYSSTGIVDPLLRVVQRTADDNALLEVLRFLELMSPQQPHVPARLSWLCDGANEQVAKQLERTLAAIRFGGFSSSNAAFDALLEAARLATSVSLDVPVRELPKLHLDGFELGAVQNDRGAHHEELREYHQIAVTRFIQTGARYYWRLARLLWLALGQPRIDGAPYYLDFKRDRFATAAAREIHSEPASGDASQETILRIIDDVRLTMAGRRNRIQKLIFGGNRRHRGRYYHRIAA